ncbi:hypothetical protein C2S52_020956 [Perilla frutescens var. hirtella]|nr:hypothetical protein C2S52_020956 [Perilla frutescens var. hirtella]
MDLMKEKKRLTRKRKKDVNRGGLRSSYVETEGDKEVSSDFTSKGKVFEKDEICYEAKPLQVVEAGALIEKSIFEVAKQSGASDCSLDAEIGSDIGVEGGKLREEGSDLVQDREELIFEFLSKNEDVVASGMAEEDDRMNSKLQINESEEDQLRVSGHEKLGHLAEKGLECGEHCQNNLQKSIRVDRTCEDSELVFDRDLGQADASGVVNPSKFIQSMPHTTVKEMEKLDGMLNHDPNDHGRFPDLPFSENATPLAVFPENPNSINPKNSAYMVEPTPSMSPSVQPQLTQRMSPNPSASLESSLVNSSLEPCPNPTFITFILSH